MESKLPTRKRNRLKDFDYSSPNSYFITVCTKHKKCIFWESNQPKFIPNKLILPNLSLCGKILDKAIKGIPERYPGIKLIQYVIMPNHIHLVLHIVNNPETDSDMKYNQDRRSISIAVGQMKRIVSREVGVSIWQKSFHDHIIRNYSDYKDISEYIFENPLKWQYDCFYMT